MRSAALVWLCLLLQPSQLLDSILIGVPGVVQSIFGGNAPRSVQPEPVDDALGLLPGNQELLGGLGRLCGVDEQRPLSTGTEVLNAR